MSHRSIPSLPGRPVLLAAANFLLASCGQESPLPSTSPGKPSNPVQRDEPAASPDLPIGRSASPAASPGPLALRSPGDPTSAIASARGSLDAIQARVFQSLTDEESAELDSLIAAYQSSTSADDRLNAINAMSEFYSRELLEVAGLALSDKDPAVRQAALALLSGSTSKDVLPIAEQAIGDDDVHVRAAAAAVVARVSDPAVVPLFQKGVADSSDAVRFAFLDASAHVSLAIQNPVLETALRSETPNVRSYALAILEQNISSMNFPIVLDALDTPDPDFREEISLLIRNLVDQEFASAAEARSWWEANQERYDRELFLKP